MKALFLLVTLSSCSFIKVGQVTDLYLKNELKYKELSFLSIEKINFENKDQFSFFYIVNFDCQKNGLPKLDLNNNEFYIVENSIINLDEFYYTLNSKTEAKVFYYFPEKGFKNPNKDFESYLEKLKENYVIEQKAYFVKAKKK